MSLRFARLLSRRQPKGSFWPVCERRRLALKVLVETSEVTAAFMESSRSARHWILSTKLTVPVHAPLVSVSEARLAVRALNYKGHGTRNSDLEPTLYFLPF